MTKFGNCDILTLALGEKKCQEREKKGGEEIMAKTKSSTSGTQHKKIVPVKPYKKGDGTTVKGHRRSTPN